MRGSTVEMETAQERGRQEGQKRPFMALPSNRDETSESLWILALELVPESTSHTDIRCLSFGTLIYNYK